MGQGQTAVQDQTHILRNGRRRRCRTPKETEACKGRSQRGSHHRGRKPFPCFREEHRDDKGPFKDFRGDWTFRSSEGVIPQDLEKHPVLGHVPCGCREQCGLPVRGVGGGDGDAYREIGSDVPDDIRAVQGDGQCKEIGFPAQLEGQGLHRRRMLPRHHIDFLILSQERRRRIRIQQRQGGPSADQSGNGVRFRQQASPLLQDTRRVDNRCLHIEERTEGGLCLQHEESDVRDGQRVLQQREHRSHVQLRLPLHRIHVVHGECGVRSRGQGQGYNQTSQERGMHDERGVPVCIFVRDMLGG